jgi:hypothetical protein
MADKLNLMQRMNMIICDLQAMNLKKTGLNKSEKRQFYYYELGDFLPCLNELCKQHGIYKQIWFTDKYAYLRISNAEDPKERLLYTSPMRSAAMPASQPIQLLGAEQTYQRRYLLMNAFEIVENDIVDAAPLQDAPKQEKSAVDKAKETFPGSKEVSDEPEKKPAQPAKKISVPQQKRLFAMSGGDKEIINALLAAAKIEKIEEIPMGKVYDAFCDKAEKMAANKATAPEPEQTPAITDSDIPF